jgi:hypothetical protein
MINAYTIKIVKARKEGGGGVKKDLISIAF